MSAVASKRNAGVVVSLVAAGMIAGPVASYAAPVPPEKMTDLSFSAAFPKPFYQQSAFPFVIFGATAVAAGVLSYFTAGAGAPVAASGVSTVAAFLGGGGAGSYMAGLSAVGSWVGGNAMVGAAILNGASFGLGGSFAAESLTAKALVMMSVSATVMDGVLVFQPAEQKATVRVRLEVPTALASGPVAELVKAYERNIQARIDACRINPKACDSVADDGEDAIKYKVATAANDILADKLIDVSNTVVVAVLSSNTGDSQTADKLLKKIPRAYLSKQGYYSYLSGVFAIENGLNEVAVGALSRAILEDPYAIEPVILRVNYLANFKGFAISAPAIENEALMAPKHFDDGKYSTPYGLATLDYRVASIYLANQKPKAAERWFREADKNLSFLQKHFRDTDFHQLITVGIATALCDQKRVAEANSLFKQVRESSGKTAVFNGNTSCRK